MWGSILLRKLRTSSLPWCGLAGLAFVLGVFVLTGGGQEVVLLVALFVFLGACFRGLVLAVRDDEVSSATIRSPGGRTLAIIGSDSAAARRRRRIERDRRRQDRPRGDDART
jgi:hypothetical protein